MPHETRINLATLGLATIALALAEPALASSGGGGLPWESPLQQIQQSITGPVAGFIALAAVAIAGGIGSLPALIYRTTPDGREEVDDRGAQASDRVLAGTHKASTVDAGKQTLFTEPLDRVSGSLSFIRSGGIGQVADLFEHVHQHLILEGRDGRHFATSS